MNNLHPNAVRLLFDGREESSRCIEIALGPSEWSPFAQPLGQTAGRLLPGRWRTEDVFLVSPSLLGLVTHREERGVWVSLIDLGELGAEQARAEIDGFAYKASHDMQEPLRKIIAFGERLVTTSGDELNPEGRLFVERMQAAARRLQHMLDGLLDYSRAGNPVAEQRFDDLESAVLDAWQSASSNTLDTELVLPVGGLPVAREQATALHPVLVELFSNALKFRSPDRSPRLVLQTDRDGDRWRLLIHDNGIGFDPEHAERIFSLFERLHGVSAYPGSGMGLAVARKRVHTLGGALHAEGRPDNGATFILELPALPDQQTES